MLKVEGSKNGDRYFRMSDLTQFKAEFFKALAHPLRIKILDCLRKGECGVNELCARVGAEQSTLSLSFWGSGRLPIGILHIRSEL